MTDASNDIWGAPRKPIIDPMPKPDVKSAPTSREAELLATIKALEAALELAENRLIWASGIIHNDTARDIAGAYVDEVKRALAAAKQTTPDASPTVAEAAKVPDALLKKTFAIQYNPNCPSPWLVRLVGKGMFIDMKSYSRMTPPDERTGDILGFGKTLEEAALRALSEGGE